MPRLVLASTSPRRRRILAFLGIPFQAAAPLGVIEERRRGESPRALAVRLALEKALSLRARYPERWILGADTLVVLGDRVFGKPKGPAQLRRTLSLLSGRRHQVLTGMVLLSPKGGRYVGVGESRVTFRALDQGEMTAYARTREPYDKAGGYAIQGTAAGWVRRLEGDYFNVMGLPANLLLETLAASGWIS
ncbi:MAG TPA: nucleoside triphosphate pyrophosphatase [bacterium]|nr:nucleoside triphosphate pyrophosphatase [bacterium]